MAVVAEKIESFEKRGRLLALQVQCVWTYRDRFWRA
jgi:hypothetical protein